MKSLNLLLQHAPAWVRIEKRQNGVTYIVAESSDILRRAARSFQLELKSSSRGGVVVMEQAQHRQFASFCLERHINPDSTFCVYLGSEYELNDYEATEIWWSHLASYLRNQTYAEKHRVWPIEAGLSHGDAAHEQIAMENLAEPLGWRDDTLRAIFRGKGWLAQPLPSIWKRGGRVLNSRARCPRGCTWKHKLLRRKSCEVSECYPDCGRQHKPVLLADCPNRNVVESLVLYEHRRRKIEIGIVQELADDGRHCCGMMKSCPLRDIMRLDLNS